MIRDQIAQLVKLGPFPDSREVLPEVIGKQEQLLRETLPPVTDAEARALVALFGPDDYFGCAWTILHLIESAPNWPLNDCLANNDANEWITRLKLRLERQ